MESIPRQNFYIPKKPKNTTAILDFIDMEWESAGTANT
jgi:hypothetical protein